MLDYIIPLLFGSIKLKTRGQIGIRIVIAEAQGIFLGWLIFSGIGFTLKTLLIFAAVTVVSALGGVFLAPKFSEKAGNDEDLNQEDSFSKQLKAKS